MFVIFVKHPPEENQFGVSPGKIETYEVNEVDLKRVKDLIKVPLGGWAYVVDSDHITVVRSKVVNEFIEEMENPNAPR